MTDTVAHQRRTPKAPNHIKHETSARPTYCVFDTTAFQMASKRSTVNGHMDVSNFETVTVDTILSSTQRRSLKQEMSTTNGTQKDWSDKTKPIQTTNEHLKKKKMIQQIVQPKNEVQQAASHIIFGRGMETCSGRKNELTQCPRHADVFTYPRRPSVHTGHPAGTHTSTDKLFLGHEVCLCQE